MRKVVSVVLCAAILFTCGVFVSAAEKPSFEYQIQMTASDGSVVTALNRLAKGETLNIRIRAVRTDITEESYEAYGMEFTLQSKGLRYNGNGTAVRGSVSSRVYPASGRLEVSAKFLNSGGNGYYGSSIAREETMASWSYTVSDPSEIELTEAVMLVYPMENTAHTVTFDANGGQVNPARSETDSSGRVKLPVPTREGYSFEGWFTAPDGGDKVSDDTKYAKDTTIYANWKKNEDSAGSSSQDGNPSGDNPSDQDRKGDDSTGDKPSDENPSGDNSQDGLNRVEHLSYIQGYEDGTVRPEGNLTRAETATIIYRLLTNERRDAIFTTKNNFLDVALSAWYNKAVSSMEQGGYILGYPDGTFRADNSITRAEFVTIIVRFLNSPSADAEFPDVNKDHWAYPYIAAAVNAGWITGYPDGSFRPDQSITRAEAMTILNRVLERGVNQKSTLGAPVLFPDNIEGKWYYYEVIEATNDHTFEGARPSENWTGNRADREYDIAKYELPYK